MVVTLLHVEWIHDDMIAMIEEIMMASTIKGLIPPGDTIVIMRTLMLFVFGFASSWAADYELLLEDSDIFSPCTEPPPGSIGFHDAFDIGDLVVDQDMDIIHLSECHLNLGCGAHRSHIRNARIPYTK